MKKLIPLFSFLYCTTLQAQTCPEIWLQGQYVEVGISYCGTYGTSAAPPAGFHPNASLPGLGYVLDYEKDGWATSLVAGAPHYCGDYFVPGSPTEGWAITANGLSFMNTNICGVATVPCISAYLLPGTAEDTSVWIGNPLPSLQVTQMTMVPDTDLYFLTRICIENTSSTDTITGVYYARNVDPDNEQAWTGNFTTQNSVIHQPIPGVSDTALVTAIGVEYGCYFGFGTIDSTCKVGFGGFATIPADSIYHSTGGIPRETTPGASNISDQAVSIAWNLGNILPGQEVCFSFAHVLNPADLGTALLRTGHWTDSTVVTSVPLPSASQFTITQTSGEEIMVILPASMNYKGATLDLFDVNGSKVRSQAVTSSSFQISTNGLPPGVYIARIFKGDLFLGQTKTVVR